MDLCLFPSIPTDELLSFRWGNLDSLEKHFRHERHVGLHGDDGSVGADVRLGVGGDGGLVGQGLVVEVSVLLTTVTILYSGTLSSGSWLQEVTWLSLEYFL